MISRSAKYALCAMVCLAKQQQDPEGASGITSQGIARQTEISQGYLVKVLQRLARDRLVTSRRGPTGGFTLRRPADQINLLEIIAAVEPIDSNSNDDRSSPSLRKLDRVLKRSREKYIQSLQQTTLSDIVRDEQRTEHLNTDSHMTEPA